MYNKKAISDALAKLNKAKAPKQEPDIIYSPRGQWDHPGEITRVPSEHITMQGVNTPLLGIDNMGNQQIMQPGAEYTFPGADYVDEYPMMQSGGQNKSDWRNNPKVPKEKPVIYTDDPNDPRIQAYIDDVRGIDEFINYIEKGNYIGMGIRDPDWYLDPKYKIDWNLQPVMYREPNNKVNSLPIKKMSFDQSLYKSIRPTIEGYDVEGPRMSFKEYSELYPERKESFLKRLNKFQDFDDMMADYQGKGVTRTATNYTWEDIKNRCEGCDFITGVRFEQGEDGKIYKIKGTEKPFSAPAEFYDNYDSNKFRQEREINYQSLPNPPKNINYRFHREYNPFTQTHEVMSPSQHKMLEREAYKLFNSGEKKLTPEMMPENFQPEPHDVVTRKPLQDQELFMYRLQNEPEFAKTYSPLYTPKRKSVKNENQASLKYGGLVTGLTNTKGNLLMNKKGKRMMAKSGSLSATNELFLGNPLVTKRRRAVFVPGHDFQEGGSIELELSPAQLAMMKARLAYAHMHGNPSAQRMVAPVDNPYIFTGNELYASPDTAGYPGTHYMFSQGPFAVPTIQTGPDGQLYYNVNASPNDPEAIQFDSPEDAEIFARHYKTIAPAFQDMELTDKEIEEYRRGGYIVEELPQAQSGNQGRISLQEFREAAKAQEDREKQEAYFSGRPKPRIPTSEQEAKLMIEKGELKVETPTEVKARKAREAEARKQERIRLQEDYEKRQDDPEYSGWTGLPGESWRETLAAEAAPMEAMLRVSNEDNFFDDYINPAAWIGSMAKGLGEAPLQAQKTDSYLPYVTSIGMPLLGGAAAGIGTKTTGQFVNNMVNPFAGVNPLKSKQLPGSPNAASSVDDVGKKFKINNENFYRSIDLDDAVNSGVIRSKQSGEYAKSNPYFVEGKDFDNLSSTGSGATGSKPKYIFEMSMVDETGTSLRAYPTNATAEYAPYIANKSSIPISEGKIYKLNDKGEYELFNPTSSVDDVGKGFRSEIDWAKWNKEIPENKALMQEYNAIEQKIKTLKDQETLYNTNQKKLWQDYKEKKITGEEYNKKIKEISPWDSFENPIYPLEKKLRELKVKQDIINTPQKNILTSEKQLGKNISDGGTNNKGVFELENDYVARLSAHGYDDASRLVNYSDKLKSPRIMKTHQVKEIDGKVYQVQDKATGVPANKLNESELQNIPKQHIDNLYKDIAELEKNGLNIDISGGKSNVFYDSKKGFQFIDLGIGKMPDITDINKVLLKKQNGGIIGNNGMFDMTNPNIYKALIPATIATGVAASNEYKQGGSIDLKLTPEEIEWYMSQGYNVEEFQDGGEIISKHGWDYKKEGDKYFTKKVGDDKWIEPTGTALTAIQQKVFGDVEYTAEDKKLDYINHVQLLIDQGYTLNDLVKQRVGTKEGLLNLFPQLDSSTAAPVEAQPKQQEELVNRRFPITLGLADYNKPKTFSTDIESIKARAKKDALANVEKETAVSERPVEMPNIPTWHDIPAVDFSSRQPGSLQEIPNMSNWQDFAPLLNQNLSIPEYIEADLTEDEIKELEAEGHVIEEVKESFLDNLQNNVSKESVYNRGTNTFDPFGRKLKTPQSQQEIQDAADWYNQTAESKGLKEWKPESAFSLGDIVGTGNITDFTEGVTDLVKLGETYFQRKSDKNSKEAEAKTKSISELKSENSEMINEDSQTYNVNEPIIFGEDLKIENTKYNPTGRRVYRQEYIELENTKFGFRNRGDMQEIISKGGSVTAFYPFELKKDIEKENKYPADATFIGISPDGSFKTGKIKEFENTDKISRVFSNLVDDFVLNEDGSVKLEVRNKDNPNSPVPVVKVIEKDSNGAVIKKEGSINVLTKKVKDARNQYGPIQGGRVVLKGSDGKTVLVSGSLNNIYEQFKEIRERTGKPVEVIQLDNGSYNLGLATEDNKMTKEDLKAYDNLHTSGGNFLYIIDETFSNKGLNPSWDKDGDGIPDRVQQRLEEQKYVADIPDYSGVVQSPTATIFRKDIIIPKYKYGMSTDDLLKEKGYMGKGIGKDPYMDCSGAVCKVMTSLGKDLGNPLSTDAQKIHNKTKEIKDINKWKDGDIITFNTEGSKIDHIGFLVIDENTGKKYIAESSRTFQEGRIVPFQQRLDYLYSLYPDMKYYIRRFQ